MQRERRRDPYPWTWELPLAVTLTALFALVVGIQVGRSVANLLAGAGWTWPAPGSTATDGAFTSPLSGSFWTSLPGVLAGDSGAGLAAPGSARGGLAGRGLTWGSVLAAEAVIVVGLCCVGFYVVWRWGSGRMQGMATASEAEQLLGVTRLRKVAGIVRPDLYGQQATTAAPDQGEIRGGLRAGDRASDGGGALDAAAHPGSPLGRGLSRLCMGRLPKPTDGQPGGGSVGPRGTGRSRGSGLRGTLGGSGEW